MFSAHSQIGLMRQRHISKALILVACICLWSSQAIAAESPLDAVRTGTDQVIKILKEYPQDTQARREKIRAVIDKYFDFEGVSRLALGPQWNRQPPAKQQEFSREFSRLLFSKYIENIDNYANEKITYSQRKIGPQHVVVEAVVGGQAIDYALHFRNGNWTVYDVSVGGLSLVINYRSQFDQMLANGSFDNLLMTLKQQVAERCGTNRC
jgi:phospholipid transport system substrate-binding protein